MLKTLSLLGLLDARTWHEREIRRTRTMRRTSKAGAVLGLGLLLFVPRVSLGRTPILTTPHFAFYSDGQRALSEAAASLVDALRKPEPQKKTPSPPR
jgi:hypothetical protein